MHRIPATATTILDSFVRFFCGFAAPRGMYGFVSSISVLMPALLKNSSSSASGTQARGCLGTSARTCCTGGSRRDAAASTGRSGSGRVSSAGSSGSSSASDRDSSGASQSCSGANTSLSCSGGSYSGSDVSWSSSLYFFRIPSSACFAGSYPCSADFSSQIRT